MGRLYQPFRPGYFDGLSVWRGRRFLPGVAAFPNAASAAVRPPTAFKTAVASAAPKVWRLRRLRDRTALASALMGSAWPNPTAGRGEAFGRCLAAYTDAEGHLGVDRRGHGFAIYTVHRSEAALAALLQRRLGGGRVFPDYRSRHAYRLRITDRTTLRKLLTLAEPFLCHPQRRRQAL